MIEIKRKKGETMAGFLRRFSRQIQLSGVLREAKKKRFYAKEPTRRLQKSAALHREKMKKEYERKKKLGIE